jgi:hypothetical protein
MPEDSIISNHPNRGTHGDNNFHEERLLKLLLEGFQSSKIIRPRVAQHASENGQARKRWIKVSSVDKLHKTQL